MREYFSHDYNARNDKKLVALFMKHGLAGVGAFWCLVEMLYESNGVILRSECDRIAFELRITNEFLNSILCDFDLFICDENAFYSESVKTRLGLRNEKSEKAKASAIARWRKKSDDANALRSQCEGNAIKVNKSKVNKSKLYLDEESEYIEKPKFNFKKSFLDLGVDNQILSDWLEVRKSKGSKNTKTAFESLLNKIKESGKTANECIKLSAEHSWAGFDIKWVKSDQYQHASNLVNPRQTPPR